MSEKLTLPYLRQLIAELEAAGGVPGTRTITINGNTQDLSANRTWTLDTGDIAEGSNLYFTDARARTAAVDNTAYDGTWNGVNDIAPSKNAVYDKIESLGAEGTFTPTVTLVGGAGNTVPVYTNNLGYYTTWKNICFVDIDLNGDGGAEGAGTGHFNIALPFASNANHPAFYFYAGVGLNSTTHNLLMGQIDPGGSTIKLYLSGVFSIYTGANQNNATRRVRLKFNYMI